jgi:hypothetical protein
MFFPISLDSKKNIVCIKIFINLLYDIDRIFQKKMYIIPFLLLLLHTDAEKKIIQNILF